MQIVAESSNREDSASGAVPALPAGSLIADRYRLNEVIGRGGMATVWRGHDERLGRDVAIKVCPPTTTDGPLPVREARLSSTLQHPNVVSIFDAGEIATDERGAGSSYIVMEFISGTTAHQIAPVGWREAVGIVRQAAEGLAAAHERGIVHCDVKPGNLLIDLHGRVLVADFGIAMPAESEIGEFVHGSPAYIAPERLAGERADPRVDVYGLGGVLAFLITGHRPSDDAISLPFDCPGQVARVISQARARNPLDRHASAREFLVALNLAVSPDITSRNDASTAVVRASRSRPTNTVEPSRRVISHPMRVTSARARPLSQPIGAMSLSPVPVARPLNGSHTRRLAFRPAARYRRGTLIAAGIVGLLLLFAVGVFIRQITSTESVAPGSPSVAAAIEMPDVQGQSFAAAIDSLSERGLVVERIDVIYGPGPINQIVAQNPAPGTTLSEDDAVTLVVRTGR